MQKAVVRCSIGSRICFTTPECFSVMQAAPLFVIPMQYSQPRPPWTRDIVPVNHHATRVSQKPVEGTICYICGYNPSRSYMSESRPEPDPDLWPPGPSCPLVFCVHQRNTTFPTIHREYNALTMIPCEHTAAQQVLGFGFIIHQQSETDADNKGCQARWEAEYLFT